MTEARGVALRDLWTRLDAPGPPPPVRRRGDSTGLASPLPVDALAQASVAAAAGAAALLAGGGAVEIDAARIGSSFRADQLMRIDGEAPGGFAPLSGFWRVGQGERGGSTRGWVRTHANYPHHRVRLLAALGLPDDDAWGWTGPWAGRRGFDSIVQAASGIAVACARDDGRPGALPAQALDHATGYLAAASALLGLAERAERGGSIRELALARTAEWLWSGPVGGLDDANRVPAVEPATQELGRVEVPPPAVVMPGPDGGSGPSSWAGPARELGADEPAWAPG